MTKKMYKIHFTSGEVKEVPENIAREIIDAIESNGSKFVTLKDSEGNILLFINIQNVEFMHA
jgi:hypothetical protein